MNDFIIKSYDEVKTKKIEWLWKPYIALGKLTILQGDPGNGKSTLALLIASVLASGLNTYGIENINCKTPINVIYQSAEDSPEDTIKPKLRRLNANCDNILFIENDENINLTDNSLKDVIVKSHCKLLILDPLQSFLKKGESMYVFTDVRLIMKNVAKIARETNCAILIIGHVNKAESSKDLYRGLGSIDIIAIARSVLYLKRDDNNSSIRILHHIKNSLAEEGESVAFRLIKDKVEWIGKYDDLNENYVVKDKLYEAKDFLCNLLSNKGKIPVKEIKKLSNIKNISYRTLVRAKQNLDIKSIRFGDAWYWQM